MSGSTFSRSVAESPSFPPESQLKAGCREALSTVNGLSAMSAEKAKRKTFETSTESLPYIQLPVNQFRTSVSQNLLSGGAQSLKCFLDQKNGRAFHEFESDRELIDYAPF